MIYFGLSFIADNNFLPLIQGYLILTNICHINTIASGYLPKRKALTSIKISQAQLCGILEVPQYHNCYIYCQEGKLSNTYSICINVEII